MKSGLSLRVTEKWFPLFCLHTCNTDMAITLYRQYIYISCIDILSHWLGSSIGDYYNRIITVIVDFTTGFVQ